MLTADINDIRDANFYIVSVGTPAYYYELPDLNPLISATTALAAVIKVGDIVVFESTVYPGTTEEVCIPILEKESKLEEGKDFFVGYSPERINPGDKEHTLANVTKIISASDSKTLSAMRDAYGSICEKLHPVSSIATAEAVKILENTQRDINIALMNEFTMVMHALDLNTHEIIQAAASKWSFMPFKPGLVGGHCISIDPLYLAFQAKRHGVNTNLVRTARQVNDGMTEFIIQSMLKLFIHHQVDILDLNIGLFGISYKENSLDIRNSLSLKLVKELQAYGFNYKIHDPLAEQSEHNLGNIPLQSFDQMSNLSVAVLLVGHDFYRDVGLQALMQRCKKPPILMDIPNLFIEHHHDDLIYWSL